MEQFEQVSKKQHGNGHLYSLRTFSMTWMDGWRRGRIAWQGAGHVVGDTRHVWLLQQMASGHCRARGEEGGRHVELGEAKQLGRPLPALEGEPPRPRHHRVHHTQKS